MFITEIIVDLINKLLTKKKKKKHNKKAFTQKTKQNTLSIKKITKKYITYHLVHVCNLGLRNL